jgi:hypothetical protein
MATNISRIFPASSAFPVTPSDSGRFEASRGIYVGATGNLRVMMRGGQTVTFNGVVAGVVHPLEVVMVYSTGTTATGIIIIR